MINRKLTTAILCACGLSVAPVTSWAEDDYFGYYPPAGVDSAESIGQFVVTFTANFVADQPKLQALGLCSDPNSSICTDEMRTIGPRNGAPKLYEAKTRVGRSAPHKDSNSRSSTDKRGAWVCQKGSWDKCEEFFGEKVKDSDFVEVLFFPLKGSDEYGEDGPVGTQEVHTQMLSLNMRNGLNAVRAGSAAPSQPRSIGEVESQSPPDGPGGFPAESFFNLYVEVDMDFDGQEVDFTLLNHVTEPLVVLGTGLTKFPPKLIYTHSATEWAAPFYRKGGGNEVVAYITMAGHGISYKCARCEQDTRSGTRDGGDEASFDKLFQTLPVAAINPENRSEKEFDSNNENHELSPTPDKLCRLYAVQDHQRNNGQLFAVSPSTLYVEAVSKVYPNSDFEALAAHPDNDMLYIASGNDSEQPGYLYRFDVNVGKLIEIGDTGFNDVPSIAFDSEGTLWGWVKGKGLITLDTETGKGTMVKAFPGIRVEDITWNNAGTHIYAAENTNLWVYEHATQTVGLACSNLPGETEALEILPDDSLLLGIHGEGKILQFQAFNVETCEIVFGVDIPTSPTVNDVEGIAWPINACN